LKTGSKNFEEIQFGLDVSVLYPRTSEMRVSDDEADIWMVDSNNK
jgi:hypothetical protein